MYINSNPVTLDVSHTGRDVNLSGGSEVGASNITTASGPYPINMNASIAFLQYLSPAPPFSFSGAHSVNYQTISTPNDPMFTCSGVCVSLIVVFALILACISVGLFLSLGFGCRRNMSRWTWGSRRPRTNASVTTSEGINLGRRSRSLQSVITITSEFGELPPVPPYPESILPPYSPYPISHTQNILADNIGPVVDSQMDDQIPSISLTYTNLTARTSATSVVYSAHTENSELHIPSTPLIPTVPLPLVEPESPIEDTRQPNFPPQQNSNDARSEIDEQLTRSFGSNRSIDEIPFEGGSIGLNESSVDMDLAQPTGSLGLSFFKSPLASCDGVGQNANLSFDILNSDSEEKSNSSAPHGEGDLSVPSEI